MSDGYIRMGYTWRQGSRISADADAVAREFEQIERETGGNGLSLEAVVVRAKMPDSPLHALLEHDTKNAAHQWHLEQAAEWARALCHRLVNPRTEDEKPGPRAYHPVRAVTDDRTRPGVYVKVAMARAPEPAPEPQPLMVTVTATPRTIAPHWTTPQPRAVEPPSVASQWPTEKPVRLTESREMARAVLLKWLPALERDEYFAGVVAAIRALP